jgi:hypothetical protein
MRKKPLSALSAIALVLSASATRAQTAATAANPGVALPIPAAPPQASNRSSWFARPPMTLSVGEGKQKWQLSISV